MLSVIPTVDVEGSHGTEPFEQFALGRIDGAVWGAPAIAAIFREMGVQGTFFVDVYEHTLWGEKPLRQLCEQLVDLGQDVQLHTHPSWRDDWRDDAALRALKRVSSFLPQHLNLMANLTEDQQAQVLEQGAELLQRWIGRPPVAHRSGGYSANNATLRALYRVGIPVDSSANATHLNSRIDKAPRNSITRLEGVLEIPVSVVRLNVGLPGLPLASRLVNLDLDDLGAREMWDAARHASQLGMGMITLSAHSYSLLDFDARFRRIRAAPKKAEALRRFLAAVHDAPDMRVLSCAAYYRTLDGEDLLSASDPVPEIQGSGQFLRLAWGKAYRAAERLAMRAHSAVVTSTRDQR